MDVLIIKLGATGDVVRTTPLLRHFDAHVTWITAQKNFCLLADLSTEVRALSWEHRSKANDRSYDLVINLEDDAATAAFVRYKVRSTRLFGATFNETNELSYTNDSRPWFDLSLISRFGRQQADTLKLQNRSTYQELIFRGLGLKFRGDEYLLPDAPASRLSGDVAISTVAGPVWPMKQWAYYAELKQALEASGLIVNYLPTRPTLLEHLADVQAHRCLVSGDSLPMHLALGSGIPCVSIFTCTSPWEIYGYGRQTKILSPLLAEFFYKRDYDARATTAVTFDEVLTATLAQLERSVPVTSSTLQ